MAQITVTINTEDETDILSYEKFAVGKQYQALLLQDNGSRIPNPESKKDFFNRTIGVFVQEVIHQGIIAQKIVDMYQATPKPVVTIDGKPVDVQPLPADKDIPSENPLDPVDPII